ncbi:MAG: hypothetical protein MJE68_01825, partial [Proteobacteria bacterium]|nr:hypothetical protein [Pseudomonadota bacterium]
IENWGWWVKKLYWDKLNGKELYHLYTIPTLCRAHKKEGMQIETAHTCVKVVYQISRGKIILSYHLTSSFLHVLSDGNSPYSPSSSIAVLQVTISHRGYVHV